MDKFQGGTLAENLAEKEKNRIKLEEQLGPNVRFLYEELTRGDKKILYRVILTGLLKNTAERPPVIAGTDFENVLKRSCLKALEVQSERA